LFRMIVTCAAPATDHRIAFEADALMAVTGVGGTIMPGFGLVIDGPTNGVPAAVAFNNARAGGPITIVNTAAVTPISVTVQWSAADPGNTIQIMSCTIEVMYPATIS
jgi:hypothetical protein